MRFWVFPTIEAPRQARQAMRPLFERVDDESRYDLTMVVSELITISVAHGASKPIDVVLTLGEGQVEGVIYDDGPGTRAITRARERRDDSLVLKIVDEMVEEWGVNRGGTRIWFRMRVRMRDEEGPQLESNGGSA
jgi:anti-sigma regulatory factor (Ser/Thr protein kinase)